MKRFSRFLVALLPFLSVSLFSLLAYSQVIVPIVGQGGGAGGVGPIGPVMGPVGGPNFPRVEFYQAYPQIIDKVQAVRLSWRVQNAVRVDIYDGFRDTTIPDLGSENFIEVWPSRSANYVLYAYGAEGQVTTARMTVILRAFAGGILRGLDLCSLARPSGKAQLERAQRDASRRL